MENFSFSRSVYFIVTSAAVWYSNLYIPLYLISLSEKTKFLKQTENIWSSCHSMYFLIFWLKFFDSKLDNPCSLSLMRFLAWLQNKQTFVKTSVVCDGFGNFMVDLDISVKTIWSSEFGMLFSQDCLLIFPLFPLFHTLHFQKGQVMWYTMWYTMADSILTGKLSSEYFKFWICLAFKILWQFSKELLLNRTIEHE